MVNKKEKIGQLLSLATCFLMILTISIGRDHKYLGHDLMPEVSNKEQSMQQDTMRLENDGTIVINTTSLAKDIIGYGGMVPLEIYIKDGKISNVKDLQNSETDTFFEEAEALLSAWNGKTLEEASHLQVDVVTGATFSSRAIIENMQRGIHYAQNKSIEDKNFWHGMDLSLKSISALIVALMAAILPIFIKNKRYRTFQQLLNIIVLGFWSGQMLSYTTLISYMSNGVNIIVMLVPTIMLISAFIYPLFNKKSYYCANVCPFGSLQELAGRCVGYKYNLSKTASDRIKLFRQWLWAILMFCLWTGVWTSWLDYEPFSAFIFGSASWVVIIIAIAFIAISTFITRPYCRWICPLGMLFKISQSNK